LIRFQLMTKLSIIRAIQQRKPKRLKQATCHVRVDRAHRCLAVRAFSGKVDTGFPLEKATNKAQLERFPIQRNRKALWSASSPSSSVFASRTSAI
jgi:hypothetical protein